MYKRIYSPLSKKMVPITSQEGLRCLEQYIRYNKKHRCPKYKRIVISADYDNCWSIFFNKNCYLLWNEFDEYKHNYKLLKQHVQSICKHAKFVGLFCGSARQSKYDDYQIGMEHFNNIQSKGKNQSLFHKIKPRSAFKDYEYLTKRKKWKLFRLLLADKDNKVRTGSAWKSSKYRLSTKHKSTGELKVAMLQNQLDYLHKLYPSKSIDFYFYDDWDVVISAVTKAIKRKQLRIPSMIRVHVIQFNQSKQSLQQIC